MSSPAADAHSRPRRSDGERTHAAILDAATRLASVEGLEGLTIGRLAEQLEVSKSGVYAHFGSREQLQLETIEAAQEIVEREVIAPAMKAPAGVRRLEALCEAYLSYVERLVFPGGCFFASLLAEMDARSGPFHEMAQAGARQWSAMFVEFAAEAQERGEIGADVDLEQLAFELDACLELANYYFVLLRDPAVLERARRATAGIIGRARTSAERGSAAANR
jgi:AcrR family transcriptional regulator